VKFRAAFVLLAATCGGMLTSAGCLFRSARVAPVVVAAPPPPAPAPAAPEEPISAPQTQVVLPRSQPIPAAALAIVPPEWPTPAPEPPAPAPKPHTAQRAERPQTAPTQPMGPQPPPPPRRRIRPVASAADQRRLTALIADRQRQAQEALARAKARQSSDAENATIERIQAFLDQTDEAIKEQDLQLADALSSRALLLTQELAPDK
jgi:hypothetical protein